MNYRTIRVVLLAAIIGMLGSVGVYELSKTEQARTFNYAIYDQFLRFADVAHNNDVLIIKIDEPSLQQLGRWPWPRNYHAQLLDILSKSSVKAVAMGIHFSERESNNANDVALAEAIKRSGNVILPIQPSTLVGDAVAFSEFRHFSANNGYVTMPLDSDGMSRSIELIGAMQNKLPSFALATLSIAHPQLAAHYTDDIADTTAKTWLIPYNEIAQMIPSVSYADVLSGRVTPKELENKVIFVGYVAAGLGDAITVPIGGVGERISGINAQAYIYSQLYAQQLVTVIDSPYILILQVVLAGLICFTLILMPPLQGAALGVGSAGLCLLTIFIVFIEQQVWLPLTTLSMALTGYTLLTTVISAHRRLKEANHTLEVRVRERTQALTLSNLSLAQEVRERETVELILRDRESQLRTLLDSLQVGVLLLDDEGQILSANKTMADLFYCVPANLIGDHLNAYIRKGTLQQEDHLDIKNILQSMDNFTYQHIEAEGVPLSRPAFPIEITFSALMQRGLRRFVCLIRDITEQKQSEIVTQEFIATVSHELRSPLTSIRGSLGLVTSGTAGQLAEQTKHLLGIALRNSERLLMLVNDILDVQKIQLGTLSFKLEQIDMNVIIEQSIEVNESYASMYSTSFCYKKSPQPVWVYGDAERLIQVMTNLLSNAAKFSPAGAVVDVTMAIKPSDIVEVRVTDYGSGIPLAFRRRIFQKFAQADNAKHRSKGTGLGLSISKTLIEKMGGSIDFDSEEGKGASFFFQLPMNQPIA